MYVRLFEPSARSWTDKSTKEIFDRDETKTLSITPPLSVLNRTSSLAAPSFLLIIRAFRKQQPFFSFLPMFDMGHDALLDRNKSHGCWVVNVVLWFCGVGHSAELRPISSAPGLYRSRCDAGGVAWCGWCDAGVMRAGWRAGV